MKIKCNHLLRVVFAFLIVLMVNNVQAQHKHKHKHPHAKKKVVHHKKTGHHNKVRVVRKHRPGQAIRIIKKTNLVIVYANKAVKNNKIHTGDLARAVHHQKYAKKLLKKDKSYKAMQHSRLARNYAFKAIRTNKGVINKDYQFNDEENKAMGDAIADADLSNELTTSNPTLKFDDALISDKELTDLQVLDVAPSDYKND